MGLSRAAFVEDLMVNAPNEEAPQERLKWYVEELH